MGISAKEALYGALCAASTWFALRPNADVDACVALLVAPARVLSEACAPLSWMRARSVRAAEADLAQREERELAEREALFDAERRAALPRAPELLAGRRFVHAEVVGRRRAHFDELVVRVDGANCAGLARGMPVIVGEQFVGRVLECDVPTAGHAVIELVTKRSFAVGARLFDVDVRCVVGGLLDARTAQDESWALALAHPSQRTFTPGPVVVDERLSPLAAFGELSQGFHLGRARQLDSTQWCVRPALDFASGLSQLAIVVPPDTPRAVAGAGSDDLVEGTWCAVRSLAAGDGRAGRRATKLSAGRWRGVRAGAAVVVGARLLGRVAHADWLSSDAQLCGDAGFRVQAVARIEGRDEPFVLGRIVALGPTAGGANGAVEFHWSATTSLPVVSGVDSVEAQLFTGSGEALVPRGLLLGRARLPLGPGPHRIVLAQDVDTRSIAHAWVRTTEDAQP